MQEIEEIERRPELDSQKPARLLSLKTILFAFILAVFTTVSVSGWLVLYQGYLETGAPEIEITDMPRGIGLSPVSININFTDNQAGLDEVVVKIKQKGPARELVRKSLRGQNVAAVTIDLGGEKSSLEDGVAELEIRAFDRSFWSNAAVNKIPLKVDYRKPRVEVLTTQHNAREGGSQIVFYKASDEDLAISGVKVGREVFPGYPARGIDKELVDKDLYVAIYALSPSTEVNPDDIRVFAEDQVGNGVSVGFYNKVFGRRPRPVTVKLGSDFLHSAIAKLSEFYRTPLKNLVTEGQARLENTELGGSSALRDFKFVNEVVRSFSEGKIKGLIPTSRFEASWQGAFMLPAGSVQIAYDDEVSFILDGVSVGKTLQSGIEFGTERSGRDVYAANDGVVVFTETLGTYGNMIGVDHGLGVSTIYAHLERPLVKKGDSVVRGQLIGVAGLSGFARTQQLYFEVRVNGVPVDPVEWCDAGWFFAHVTGKVNDVRKTMGLPAYTPLS